MREDNVVPFRRPRRRWADSVSSLRQAMSLGIAPDFVAGVAIAALQLFAVVVAWPDGRIARGDATATPGLFFTCTVRGVHDGDGPIYCAEGQKVRLTAVAARELDGSCRRWHPCPAASGIAARDGLYWLTTGERLTCRKTGRSYGRVTAWCWRADGVELNCAMVEQRLALHWRRFDPDWQLCRQPPPAA